MGAKIGYKKTSHKRPDLFWPGDEYFHPPWGWQEDLMPGG